MQGSANQIGHGGASPVLESHDAATFVRASRLLEPVAQKRLARIDVVSLMDTGVLSSLMKIAHASLQRRTLIDRAAAGQGKAGRRDADTGGCYPDPRLGALRLKSCCESLDHGQATGQIELEPAMTFGHEHAKDTE